MTYFWDTKETIADGVGFSLFDVTHLLWLAACIVICAGMCVLYRRAEEPLRRRLRIITAILLVLDEIAKDVVLHVLGLWIPEYLPLHLCSINIFVCAAHAWRPSTRLAEFLYAVCVPGALLALFFPSWTALPAANFMHLHSFTVHILLLLYPLLLLAGGHRPAPARLKQIIIPLVITAACIFVFNKIVDTNFMFLNEPGEGNPLVYFEQWFGNPGYLIGVPILLVVIWTLMYLPFWKTRKAK